MQSSNQSQLNPDSRSILVQAVVFGGLWGLFNDGSPASWIVGFPTVCGAIYASVTLGSGAIPHFHLFGVIRFIAVFLWEALRGGVTVAVRAFHPRLPLAPVLIEYPLQLPENSARIMFANTVSLLPGTLSVMFHDHQLTVHALDGNPEDIIAELRSLERIVADCYGIALPAPASPEEATHV